MREEDIIKNNEELMNIKNSLGVYIHITSLEEFMETDPPCKDLDNFLEKKKCFKSFSKGVAKK